jgi:tRNA (guanosine-2'-O-)-methyltransferase
VDKQINNFFNSFQRKQDYVNYMQQFVTRTKLEKIEAISSQRTRFATVVLEDLYQSHNASAVLRSCDVFGVQDVHIIENINRYKINNEVAMGSAQWVNLNRYSENDLLNTERSLQKLKDEGYRIVATSPHKDDFDLESFPLDSKFALVFGTENIGLSDAAMSMADTYLRIPMFGFTESLNISVSVAICLNFLMNRLRKSDINWKLSAEEKLETEIVWLKNIVKNSDAIERDYIKKLTLSL